MLLAAGAFALRLFRRERRRRQDDLAQWRAAREQMERDLARQQGLLDRWLGFSQRLHERGLSPSGRLVKQELADEILDAAGLLTGARQSVLLETTADALEVVPVAARGLTPQQVAALRIRSGDGALGRVAAGGAPIIRNEACIGEKPEAGFLSSPYVAIPIVVPLRLTGVLVLAQPIEKRFDPETLRLIEGIAREAALLLGYLGLLQDLYAAQDETVSALAQAIDAKDPCTHRHSDRTRSLVRAMAADLRVPEPWIRQIEYGALLHDVGKIGVSDAILRKPGQLTPAEYESMKQHPGIGYRILAPAPFLRPVASIVFYHQEWYNGNGYPEGLAGEEIPLGARLVAVIDAWDAMTSDRPYRKAMTKTAAIAELRRQAGTQFDPKLVDVFLRALERLDREGVPTTERAPEEPAARPQA